MLIPSSCRRCSRPSPSGGSSTRNSRSSPGCCRKSGFWPRPVHQLAGGEPFLAQASVIFAKHLARHPLHRDHAACRPADRVALALRGRDARRRQFPGSGFRFVTYPLLTPIIAVVMTFSVLFTFTDFQLIWAMTRGGPVNATHLMATLSLSARASSAGGWARARRSRRRWCRSCSRHHGQLVRPAEAQVAAG